MNGKNGGARPGAGRPRNTKSIERDNATVAKKLIGGAQAGWEVLADEYPSIVRLAVEMAFGKHDPDNKPDKAIIKTLLELLPKVVGPETDNSESPIAQIVRELIANRTAD